MAKGERNGLSSRDSPSGCSLASLVSNKTKSTFTKWWFVSAADGHDLKNGVGNICGLCQRDSTQWLEEGLSLESLCDPEEQCRTRSSQILPLPLNIRDLPQKL